ncbi:MULTISPECIES: sensor histidine kinase [Pseudofrankia]|uniref:sensor histidine kinase n=1 Tax=Pseudofrankia TaxID=2994363 RepID=UPI000234C8F0|nr:MULTISPECIES: histidine kinase [Pseudofrankia]OHV38234.1 hypothetical protein BCD49_14965 [Pseudofrankia sp. EUN1h]
MISATATATATADPGAARRRSLGPWRRVRAYWLGPGLAPGPRPAVRGQLARLSPWAWTADAILAFVLVALTLVAARDGGSLVVPRIAIGASDAPAPPDAPARAPAPPAQPPALGDAPDWAGTNPGGLGDAPDPAEPADPADRPDRGDLAGFPSDADGLLTARRLADRSPEPVPYWQLVAAVLIALPLAGRRWRPLAAYWAVLVATVVFHRGVLVEDAVPFTFVALLVAAYGAAVYSPHRALAAASVVVGGVQVIAFPNENIPDFRPVYVPFIMLVLVGLTANALHLRQQRALVVAAEQEAASQRAVEQERARIARELHDVVTHNVSVMVIQAGAARKVLSASPDQAREAMLAVESSGRAAMTELRHVMGLLTMPDTCAADSAPDGAAAGPGAGDASAPDEPTDDELAPQPGLSQLPALVDRVRAAGVDVELTMTGTPVELSPGIDLAAFRVVQEGLTNAVRHAAGARVRIAVDHGPGALCVDVTDSGGRPAAVAGPGGGAGLVGLRERLAVYGGSLRAGRRPLGGFGVRAEIPIEAGPGRADGGLALGGGPGTPESGPARVWDGSA